MIDFLAKVMDYRPPDEPLYIEFWPDDDHSKEPEVLEFLPEKPKPLPPLEEEWPEEITA